MYVRHVCQDIDMPAAEGDTSTGGALASAADIVVRVHRRRVRVKKRKKKGKSRQVTFKLQVLTLICVFQRLKRSCSEQ
jgi:hypothetical protein